jgi:hypothetical protein
LPATPTVATPGWPLWSTPLKGVRYSFLACTTVMFLEVGEKAELIRSP